MKLRAPLQEGGWCFVLLPPHGHVQPQCHPRVTPADTPVRHAFVEGPRRAPVVRGVQPWRAGREHEMLEPRRSTREVLHEQDEADTLGAPDHGQQALVKEALPEAARDDPR